MVQKHLSDIFFERVEKYAEKAMLHYRNNETKSWIPISWKRAKERVADIANTLQINGIKEADNVGIFSQNMPEVIIIELSLFCNRAVSVPMYATSTAEQIEYLINDAEINLLIVGEQQQYDSAFAVQQRSKVLKQIVILDPKVKRHANDTSSQYLSEVEAQSDSKGILNPTVEKRQKEAGKEDMASLIYTSGTTGNPKGVMLYHSNIIGAIKIHNIRLTKLTENDITMCFLPLSHIFEKMWTYYCMYKGMENYINLRPVEIQKTIKEVRPTVMCSVPRFWEKVFEGVQEKIESSKGLMKKMMVEAVEVGYKYNVEYVRNGITPPALLTFKYRFFEKTVFATLKKVIGIDRGNFFPCAGSPLSDTINQFLHSVGIDLCYGYGLTETTATVSCFKDSGYTFGTVGEIMPEVEVKISETGEIMIKGETVFKGYYKRPEVNAESFEDGWFKTGDAGRMTDKHELIITDRIKDLFKTSNGKYVAPQAIETKLLEDTMIDQIALIGDNRKFITALIVPNVEAVKRYAAEQKIPYADLCQLLDRPQLRAHMAERINNALKAFAQFEQIKRFALLDTPFTMEGGELTNTLKLRRKVVAEKYKETIEGLYY